MNSIMRMVRLKNTARAKEAKAIMASARMLERTRPPVFGRAVELCLRLAQTALDRVVLAADLENERTFRAPVRCPHSRRARRMLPAKAPDRSPAFLRLTKHSSRSRPIAPAVRASAWSANLRRNQPPDSESSVARPSAMVAESFCRCAHISPVISRSRLISALALRPLDDLSEEGDLQFDRVEMIAQVVAELADEPGHLRPQNFRFRVQHGRAASGAFAGAANLGEGRESATRSAKIFRSPGPAPSAWIDGSFAARWRST